MICIVSLFVQLRKEKKRKERRKQPWFQPSEQTTKAAAIQKHLSDYCIVRRSRQSREKYNFGKGLCLQD